MTELTGRRILVVEDEPLLAESMKEDLEQFGAEVIGPARSVTTAIAAIAAAESVDAAVLDVKLRGENSFPVASDLTRQGVPFVFLTGFDRSAVTIRFDDIPVFEKPVSVDVLVAALNEEMRKSEEARKAALRRGPRAVPKG